MGGPTTIQNLIIGDKIIELARPCFPFYDIIILYKTFTYVINLLQRIVTSFSILLLGINSSQCNPRNSFFFFKWRKEGGERRTKREGGVGKGGWCVNNCQYSYLIQDSKCLLHNL